VRAPATNPELEGRNLALLKALHLLTRDGQLNQDARRKLKQIDHLLQFITPLLDQCAQAPVLVDHGAGKSYLGFLLWDKWFKSRIGTVIGVEQRSELVSSSQALAANFGFHGMRFVNATVNQAPATGLLPERIDVVTALHACDTATDDAISFGLAHRAEHMALVPCCQAQVAAALRATKSQTLKRLPLAELWRHPLHTREFGAQITNVLRCLRLEASGYQVTVTELVGWEHSMKNELILASKHPDVSRHKARERLRAILEEIGLGEMHARFAPDAAQTAD
jgi:Methyltransferase domain